MVQKTLPVSPSSEQFLERERATRPFEWKLQQISRPPRKTDTRFWNCGTGTRFRFTRNSKTHWSRRKARVLVWRMSDYFPRININDPIKLTNSRSLENDKNTHIQRNGGTDELTEEKATRASLKKSFFSPLPRTRHLCCLWFRCNVVEMNVPMK